MIQRLLAYKEDKTSETSLIMGSIEVSLKTNPGKKYLLKPNQKLILSNDLPVKAAKSRVEVALPEIAGNLVEIMPLTYLPGTQTNIESSWQKIYCLLKTKPLWMWPGEWKDGTMKASNLKTSAGKINF